MPDLSKLSDDELLALHSQASAPQATPDLTKLSDDELIKLRDQTVMAARPKTAEGESFIRGAAQGATFGFADEITAAGESLITDKPYREALAESRANYGAAQADNPKTYLGGNVTGGIATSLIPGVGFAKGAGAIANIGKAAVLGGTAGAGFSEANPLESPKELKNFGKDVAKGAAIGGATQGIFSVLGKSANSLKPSELKKFSNVKALKAAGFMGKDLKNMSEAQKQALGNLAHEKGLITIGGSLDDIASKAGAAKKEAGEAIGDALNSVDNLVTRAKSLVDQGKLGGELPPAGKEALKKSIDKQFQFNMNRIGERIEKELITPNAKNPLLDAERAKLTSIAKRFRSIGGVSMKEGNVIKGTQGKVTNFNSDTVPQAFKKELYDIIKTEIDDVVGKTGNLEAGVATAGGKTIGSADVASRNASVSGAYEGAKKTYGGMKQIEEVASERLGQTQGNREISLTDTIAGVAGLATGSPANVIVLGGANKLMRQYGDSVMSVGARKAAEVLEKTPRVFGKFAGILEAAAKKGAPSLNTTHAALMKDPDYRAILENFEKSQAIQRRLGQ
jgi:hypothetical protein